MSSTVLESLGRGVAPDALPPAPEVDEGLCALTEAFGLSRFEQDLLLLAALPELHEGWGDRLAGLGATWRRPSVGLALRLLVPDPEQRARVGLGFTRLPLVERGLVRLGMPDLPEPDRPLRPSRAVLSTLQGATPRLLEGDGRARALDASDGALLLEARPSLRALVDGLGQVPVVQVGRAGAGGALDLARALAAARGCGLVRVRATDTPEVLQDASVLAALGQVVLVTGPGSPRLDAAPPRGVLVLATPQPDVDDALLARRIDVPAPTPTEVARLWRALAPELPDDDPLWDVLANQTRLGFAAMRRALATARGAGLSVRALLNAIREDRTEPATPSARISRPEVPWDALVVPEAVQDQLAELRARVEHRVTVQYRWGMSHQTGRGDGVVALLHGDSGVGKTFACEALASAFGLPLVKVDLSRVVSKYIGETGKNLEQLFAMAEGFGYLLLFDEADAVFGKRTGVRDAHDRYANTETNYLLQRLETFEGVAVLSTNLLKNIDEAFLRRLQLVIHLPRPAVAQRRALWDRSLPAAARGDDVDLEALARRFDLVGGEIRNAAVRAAYLAAPEGSAITRRHLLDAIRIEFAKKGRPYPAGP